AVDPGLALGVQAVPAETPTQVSGVDAGETAVRVDRLDARPHVERVVVLLVPLVGVERFAMPERPLTLAARPAYGAGRGCGYRHYWRPSGDHGRTRQPVCRSRSGEECRRFVRPSTDGGRDQQAGHIALRTRP